MRYWESLPIVLLFSVIMIPSAEGATIKQTVDGGMDIEITHPEVAVIDRTITISFLVKNNGWENKQDVTFTFSPDSVIVPIEKNLIQIKEIAAGGSYGETINFKIASDASLGSHFVNIKYSQVLLANNQNANPPTQTNIAIPILIKDNPNVTIHTITPESLFTNAEFPFTVEIVSEDIEINDVRLEIIPPKDIDFRGETLHTFSSIQKNTPISVTSRIIAPSQEINTQYNVPFQVIVTYIDDVGNENSDSKTVSLLMRPRTFMELTTDGGIWIGDFFIAPYVSVGTIIGIPIGTILSLVIRKKYYTKSKKKTKRK
ncbi:MAG TPA: CARDB domain-containing protein [Nitrosopumilaceae archaeon]|nr:CARDB domain-containing protein [Nitrosopumilaceae archaeon]